MSATAGLRDAAAALDAERVIAALDAAFAAWRVPASRWRERLAAELPIYSSAVLDLALCEGLRTWTSPAMRALRARELAEPCRVPELTAVWLAGSIPAGAFASIALPLLAGSAVYARPSSADGASARLLRATLAEVDAGVAGALAIGRDEGVLLEADAVVASGSDETIAALRARVPPATVFVGYGHKLSVAAIGAALAPEAAAAQAVRDLVLYDGRGCLSPAYLLIEDRPRGRARELCAALAAELERLHVELPRGRLSDAEEAGLRELRARLAMREDTEVWLSPGSTAWGVALVPEDDRPPAGTLRNVAAVPLRDVDALDRWCAGLAPHLSSLGQAGWRAGADGLARIALRAGGSRVCPLGTLQLPPLDWRHDGMGPIAPLVRVVDVEEGSG